MSDHCHVFYLPPASREMPKLAKRDPRRFAIIDGRIQQVEEDGWILSTRSELVKVLRSESCVGEIRDLGRGGYRIFFFWFDTPSARELYITHVLPKAEVEGRARLSGIVAAVERVRERFLDEGDD